MLEDGSVSKVVLQRTLPNSQIWPKGRFSGGYKFLRKVTAVKTSYSDSFTKMNTSQKCLLSLLWLLQDIMTWTCEVFY